MKTAILLLIPICHQCLMTVNSARILCVFQMSSVSHHATFKPIARELSLRGHEVISFTSMPINDHSLTNLTEYEVLKDKLEIFERKEFLLDPLSKERTIYTKIHSIFDLYYDVHESILSHPELKKIYNDPNQKFDLVIMQVYINPTMYALAEKLKAPVIGVSSMAAFLGTSIAIGNHNPPSMFSEIYLPYNGDLSFYERFKSTVYYVWLQFYLRLYAWPKCDAIIRKYFGPGLPPISEIEKNVSALFVNTNPAMMPARPSSPTYVPLVFMHVKPPRPLSQDLQTELDSAKNGVVYFSLGSNVLSSQLSMKLRQILLAAFSELPYKILWKFEEEDLPGKPKNVIIRKWLPQQDVLAHPNVKVFFTQCGLQSVEETIDREVPMVGMPFICDQELNARKLQEWGVIRLIESLNTNKEEIIEAITDVAENRLYRNNMKKLKAFLKDEPMTGIEKVIWWSEYVIRNKGTKHLRSPMVDIAWYKYLLLDVVGLIILLIVIFVAILKRTINFFVSLFRTSKSQPTKAKEN